MSANFQIVILGTNNSYQKYLYIYLKSHINIPECHCICSHIQTLYMEYYIYI